MHPESALLRDGVAEKNTMLLQEPFTVKKLL